MVKEVIYERHPYGCGYLKIWVYGDYLCTGYYAIGSNIKVERLPQILGTNNQHSVEQGWYYMAENEDECVNRLISRLNYPTTHTCWREKNVSPIYNHGQMRFADSLTKEDIERLESNPDFLCWEQVGLGLRQYVTKPIYDPVNYTYTTEIPSYSGTGSVKALYAI